MPIGVGLFNLDAKLRHANPVLCQLLGASTHDLRGRALLELVAPVERNGARSHLDELLAGGLNAFTCSISTFDETIRWPVKAHVAAAFSADGQVGGFVLQIFDFGPVDGPPPLPQGLATVLEEGSDFLITTQADGTISYGNRAAREVLGVGAADGVPRLADMLDVSSLEVYQEVIEPVLRSEGSWQGELTVRTRQGRGLAVSLRMVAHQVPDAAGSDSIGAVSMFARDITELKNAERKLRQLATHDYLTGLPNRLLLYDRLELALNRYARYGTPVTLMFCDLDGFKPVNDAYGHQVGDAVLTEVADRIHSVVRDTDTAARLGGDEFAVLVEGVDDLELLTNVAERLVATVSEPVQVGGTTAQVGVSVGLVQASDRCHEADALVAAADASMYEAKAAGRGRYHVWTGSEG